MTQNWKAKTALFLTSQTLSILGSSLVQYALMWTVTLETKSGLMMTLFVICSFLPTFFLSPFAGVWADRYDRKKIIILSDALIALVTLALAIVFSSGHRALWLFFVAAAIRAVGSALQGPAVGAFLPQIVPQDKLLRVSGINGSIQSVIMIASPMASGALMTFAPLQVIFFIDVATAALAISVLALFLRVPPHAKAAAAQTVSYFHDMAEGFRYIRRQPSLMAFFAYMGVLLFFIAPAAFLTPLQAARSYGPEVWRLTAIEIAFSVGMLLGGALLAAWGGFRNRVRTILSANAIMALCTVVLGILPLLAFRPYWLYVAVMGIFGLALPFYNTPSSVLIQERVAEEFLGRVFSVMTMLFTSMMPLGMLVFGPLAELVRIEWILLGTGAIMALMAVLVAFSRRLASFGAPGSKPLV